MKEKISFIHAADLHLDSPFQGFSKVPETIFQDIRNSTFKAFQRLVEVAIQKEVDFILLVGDLYDHEYQTLKAHVHLRKAFEKLNDHQIKVYLSYGNHDYVNGNLYEVSYPDQVFVFPDEKVRQFIYERNGKAVATIQGFSYENQAVTENKTKEYKSPSEENLIHIAMLHGNLHGDKRHDSYAPFTINDLLTKNIDYWALGHIHQRSVLKENPSIVYPGNIQGRHRKEEGLKGCYWVEMTKHKTKLSFIPLQTIEFDTVKIDLKTGETPYTLKESIQQKLHSHKKANHAKLIHLEMITVEAEHEQWKNKGYLDEMIELINEVNIQEKNWTYIYRVSMQQLNRLHEWEDGDHFMGQLIKNIKKSPVHTSVEELYKHRQGRKFLTHLSAEDERYIKEKAYQWLTYEILNSGRDSHDH